MTHRNSLMVGAIGAAFLLASSVAAGAMPANAAARNSVHYGTSEGSHLVHFGTKAPQRQHPAIDRPLLARNPTALKAAKAQAAKASVRPGAAAAAPARSAATLGSPGSTLETLTTFPGMGLEQQVADMGAGQGTGPGGSKIAVGPKDVVEVVSSNMSVWTKAGARVGTQDLNLLFSVPDGYTFADPDILYDAPSGRWILSGSAFNAAFDTYIYIAATATSDPAGTWVTYPLTNSTATLMNQPRVTAGTNTVVMTWDSFATPCTPNCRFIGGEIWSVEKADLLAGGTQLRRANVGPDTTLFALVPAVNLSPTATEYLIYNNGDPTNLVQNTPNPSVGVIVIDGQPSLSNVTLTEKFDPTIQGTTPPPDAQQPGAAPPLNTGDDRLQTAAWRNNTLWTAANEPCPSATSGACIRLMQINTSTGILTPYELGSQGDFLSYPAVSMDGSGNAITTYMESNASFFPSVGAATKSTGAPPVTVVAGTAALNLNPCRISNPWRDYSGAAPDPSDPTDVWVAAGYGSNSTDPCDWHTGIGRLTLAAPTVSGFSPSQAAQAGGTLVDITGTGFTPATTVAFPSGPGTNVTVVSPGEVTAVSPATASSTSGGVTVTTANGTTAASGTMQIVPYQFSPSPIAPNGTLSGGATVSVTLTAQGGAASYLSFSGPGSACVMNGASCSSLTSSPTLAPGSAPFTIRYSTPSTVPTSGTAAVSVQNAASAPTYTFADTYTFTPVVASVTLSTNPIAADGDLTAGTSASVLLTAKDGGGQPVPDTTIYMSFNQTAGGGSASIRRTALGGTATPFTTDASGQIAIVYTTPATLPVAGGKDTIHASRANGGGASGDATYTFPAVTTFYFAEGYTAAGFAEILSLLMPNESGTVQIDYYTQTAHSVGFAFLSQGEVRPVDVNGAVGPNQKVSLKVTLPGPGIAERTMHFKFGAWNGSTSIVGATAPSTEWNFAEGSTLSIFSEYLTLQNPNAAPVPTTLEYITDFGRTATKTVTLPPNSRTTVDANDGDDFDATTPCAISAAGDAIHCGVGSALRGVSTRVVASLPIIAERPFYVNNYNFAYGPIRDGHVAFGANAPQTEWNFAEGTTLRGFNEYLTLQNSNASPTTVQLRYFTGPGVPPAVKTLVIPATTRATVEVFQGDLSTNPNCSYNFGTCGVGPDVAGVATQVTSDQPIVAERPMYMYFNFGAGPVAGAHDVVGANSLAKVFGFSWASTLAGDKAYLTIQNPGPSTATILATYYKSTGPVVRTITVSAFSRHTVDLGLSTVEGPGSGFYPLGVVLDSDQPVLVEKPTYSRNPATYGATDTRGYTPTGF